MLPGIRLSWGEMNLRTVKIPEELPQEFNFAAALLDRHLAEGQGSRMALWGPAGNLTYEQLHQSNGIRAVSLVD